MKRTQFLSSPLLLGLALGLSLLQPEQQVSAAIESAQVMSAAWSSSAASGFSAEAALFRSFRLLEEREIWVGPRVGVLWNSQGKSEFSFPIGLQSELWFVNALGIGLRTDVVIPFFMDQRPLSFRISPLFLLRVLHLGETGALAVNLAIPYDTHQKWNVQLGLSLQLGGLPQVHLSREAE